METWRKELYLAHHGILGQKWGKRNGPPYPLDAKDHSSAEKKAGYQKSIRYGGHNTSLYSNGTRADRNRMRRRLGLSEKTAYEEATISNSHKARRLVSKYGEYGYEQYQKSIAEGKSHIDASFDARQSQRKAKRLAREKADRVAAKDAYDHSESNRSSAIRFVANCLIDIVTLNPAYLAMDAKRAVDAFVSSVKEKRINKEKTALETDEKTGFKLKPSETSKEDDLKKVNPGFKNFDENTKNNCMLCTVAYDLRRRGYAVTANKASRGFMTGDLTRWYPKAEINMVNFANENGKPDRKLASKRFCDEVSKQGVGARGNLMVTWNFSLSGHSMAYEVTDKGVVIFDAQSGKTYKPEKILSKSWQASYARLDNVEFDPKTIKECAN